MSTIRKKLASEFEDKDESEIFKELGKAALVFAGVVLCLGIAFWLIFRPQWGYYGGGFSVCDPFTGLQYYIDDKDEGITVIGVIHSGCIKKGCLEIPDNYFGRPISAVHTHKINAQKKITSVRIPDSVIRIENIYIVGLQEVLGGSNVRIIGSYAFADCKTLTKVELGDKIEKVGPRAFEGCTGLKEIKFGNYLRLVDDYAFYGCENLENVDLGDNEPQIGEYVFEGTPWSKTDAGKRILEQLIRN